MNLYEILVPTMYGHPKVTPIRTRHHKDWDKLVQKITGGLTISAPAKGKWLCKGIEYPEKVIPVRIMCSKEQIEKIAEMTMKHYRQLAVMYYLLSSDVKIIYNPNFSLDPYRKI